MQEWLFVSVALVMTVCVLGLFAYYLLHERENRRAEQTRIAENIETLRAQWSRLDQDRAQGRLCELAFKEYEKELAFRLIEETRSVPMVTNENRKLALATILSLCVMVPATTAGLYLYYGDYSSLDARAIAQISEAKEQAIAERDLARSVSRLEEGVKKDPDNLDAWEILADHYNVSQELEKAANAYENVVRLNPKNAHAYAELADILIAIQQGDVSGKVTEYCLKALALDPYYWKALALGGAIMFNEGKYKEAVIYWNRWRSELTPGDEVYETVSANIDMAMKEGHLLEMPADPVPPQPKKQIPQAMKGMFGEMSGAASTTSGTLGATLPKVP